MGVENLALTGFNPPDCPTCKELLYRLRRSGSCSVYMKYVIVTTLQSKKSERKRHFGIHSHKQECDTKLGLKEV